MKGVIVINPQKMINQPSSSPFLSGLVTFRSLFWFYSPPLYCSDSIPTLLSNSFPATKKLLLHYLPSNKQQMNKVGDQLVNIQQLISQIFLSGVGGDQKLSQKESEHRFTFAIWSETGLQIKYKFTNLYLYNIIIMSVFFCCFPQVSKRKLNANLCFFFLTHTLILLVIFPVFDIDIGKCFIHD